MYGVCMSSHVLQRVHCCVSSLHRTLPYCFGACQECWHDNCPCESDVGSEEPSGRTEIKHCISVQEDLQYVCCVDVFIQQNCFGITAIWRASVVDINWKKPAYGHVLDKKQIKGYFISVPLVFLVSILDRFNTTSWASFTV